MDVTVALETKASARDVFAWIEDLSLYPEWLDIVSRAEQLDDEEGLLAWSIDLRARLGPLSRAKRLRMVRVDHDEPHLVRFERRELDGREHSPWVLTGEVEQAASLSPASTLTMSLHYGGGLFGTVIERVLRDEIERSRPRLAERVLSPPR